MLLGGVVEVELAGTGGVHDDIEDTELSGGEGTDHDATGTEAGEAQLLHAGLLGEVAEAGEDTSGSSGGGALVDHGEEGVGGVGDDGGGNSGGASGGEADGGLGGLGGGINVDVGSGVDVLGGLTLDGELGHGVGDLLEEDGAEAAVESFEDTVVLDDLGEGGHEAGGVGGVGDEADTGGLEGTEEDVGDELGHGGGEQVDGSAVLPSLLLAEVLGEVDLEELNTSELEPALDEVSDGGGAKSGGEGTSALLGDDLAEGAGHTHVVLDGVELHAGLDDVKGAHGGVGDAAADASSKGTLGVVSGVVLGEVSSHSE